jgi:hypothetical protein
MFTFVFRPFSKSRLLPIEKVMGHLLLLVLLAGHNISTNFGARDSIGAGKEENQRG